MAQFISNCASKCHSLVLVRLTPAFDPVNFAYQSKSYSGDIFHSRVPFWVYDPMTTNHFVHLVKAGLFPIISFVFMMLDPLPVYLNQGYRAIQFSSQSSILMIDCFHRLFTEFACFISFNLICFFFCIDFCVIIDEVNKRRLYQ